jgi:two-component system sensor kinase FixL
LHGAFGFPVHFGKELLGVIDFFSREIREPDDDLQQMFTAIGSQVGQFIVRRRAEEARSRLSAIVEYSDDAIFSETLEGVITSWNPGARKVFGYENEEIVGRLSSLLVPPDRAEEMAQMREKIQRREPTEHFETTRVNKLGRIIPVSLTLSPLKDAAGRVVGISSIARNISESKKAEAKLRAFAASLEHSNRDLEDFAFVASHDLQEPLGKVQAFADLLQTECGDTISDKGKDYLRRLHKATTRMQTLIRGLLTFSRVQTEAAPFDTVDLNILMQEALADLESRIQKAAARVEVGPLGSIDGDHSQLRQVLQNLVGNALKFTRPGVPPVIRVRTQRVWDRVAGVNLPQEVCRLFVEDNGVGIEEKYLGRIFNMFQRLRPHEYEGTGIGLATCRRIVQRHNGSLTVQSTPGQGSTFIVTLPIRQRRGDTTL